MTRTGSSKFKTRERSFNEPSPTIMAYGIDGSAPHQYKVIGPGESRKFTIEEVKRLCSFPDDFELEGGYGKQWAQLGMSVPPLMMYQVAATLRDQLLSMDGEEWDDGLGIPRAKGTG